MITCLLPRLFGLFLARRLGSWRGGSLVGAALSDLRLKLPQTTQIEARFSQASAGGVENRLGVFPGYRVDGHTGYPKEVLGVSMVSVREKV